MCILYYNTVQRQGLENHQSGPLFLLYFQQFKEKQWPSLFKQNCSNVINYLTCTCDKAKSLSPWRESKFQSDVHLESLPVSVRDHD